MAAQGLDLSQAWARRFRRETRELERERAIAQERFQQALPLALDVLVRAGATGIWLFGSFQDGTWRTESDVDLAVTGLQHLRYRQLFALSADLERLFWRSVHLILLEIEEPHVAETIRERGTKLVTSSETPGHRS